MENNPTPNKTFRYHAFGRYQRYIEPITRDPLVRGYFELIATILLISFFLMFAIRPTLNTVFSLRRKISDLTEVDKRLDNKIQALITAQSNYARFESQLNLLDRALPKSPQVDIMIIDIEAIVSRSGVEMTSLAVDKTGLTPDAWVKNTGFVVGKQAPLNFTLSVSGDFASAQKLLKNLINSPRILSISGINLVKSEKGLTDLSVDITGTGFFLP